ncbi:hypothetical protein EVC27_001 [Rhizobium phage RHph_I1_6]|uniref:Uncharacterized protein n=1 Tax=Rhizobium phage RHph_I1_6 TaxID=2509728 RepID=A0A7S5RFD9_9CAUD|nr:hypothetical protein PP745_gp001 [Rhizobium phage RHph_I1_6]QIG76526.1 hypothetical protein EVC27_001 [Rhizobium phage RHph_I1_6]
MTTITATVSNLLGTVDTTAQSVTSLVTALGRGANMLDMYVADMQYRQHTDQTIMRDEYQSVSVMKSALKITEMESEIQTKINSSPDFAAKYAEVYARLQQKLGS